MTLNTNTADDHDGEDLEIVPRMLAGHDDNFEMHPAHQLAPLVLLEMGEPHLPAALAADMPAWQVEAVKSLIKDAQLEALYQFGATILKKIVIGTSKKPEAAVAVYAEIIGDQYAADEASAGMSRQAISARAIQIRRGLGLPVYRMPKRARYKDRAKTKENEARPPADPAPAV